jgi:integrase
MGRKVEVMYLQTLTAPLAQRAYNKWAERGVPFANHTMSAASVVYNFSIRVGYCEINPFSKVLRRPHKPRKVVWTREDITRFLNVAYSSFNTRSVGLIVQMAYEWCQRLGDMSNLKWTNYNFDTKVLSLEQSKRRARVELPTTEELHEMLVQQKQEVGTDYVAPQCHSNSIFNKPYDKFQLAIVARKVIRKAGLSEELQIMDMRRTGTMEMVDAGVSLPQIMSVTGHVSPGSVTPYMKNTLTSAKNAAKLRFTNTDSVHLND